MAEKLPQTFENHIKIVPTYHVGLTVILLVNLLWAAWQLIREPRLDHVVGLLLAIGLGIIMWYLRIWPLTVQDRLIRLEETLRMREILPADLRTRLGELRRGQFVALRFAPDDELPALVRRVLDGELKSGREIKQAIRNWRPDTFRV